MTDQSKAPTTGRQTSLIVVAAVFTFLGTFLTLLRLYFRKFVFRNFGWDDYTILLAWIASIGMAAFTSLGIKYGAGKHEGNQDEVIKVNLIMELFYTFALYFAKVSILLCYLRLTADLKSVFGRVTEVLIVLFTLQIVATSIAVAMAVYTIVTDVIILVLPIPILSSLKRTLAQKVSLLGVFMVGILATIASGVRVWTCKIYTTSKDPIYDIAPINIWTFIELNLAMGCACGPALKAIATRLWDRINADKPATTAKYYDADSSFRSKKSLQPSVVHHQGHESLTSNEQPLKAFQSSTIETLPKEG
ncbi:hypothetical protein BP6252_05937 [Coleophoma cylindrospora]|uniref:Rhodopsin domain-containing protein n=1 Tax=Coleophoma cylindrospora TaxID=1849047 RepID=A0A3D8RL74_9HELO|nr:hypothetical protein BP6252_05937 [Coleophoma cylindrospora]